MFSSLISFIRDQYRTNGPVQLHAPIFRGSEDAYIGETLASTFVSSVGIFVDRFEREVATYTGSAAAIATVNGTAALHVSLKLSGVGRDDLVVTQPLTFVATCNAISYCGAQPVFVDVDRHTLGLSPAALEDWFSQNTSIGEDGVCRLRNTGQAVRACLPMHTFGHPADIDGLLAACARWNVCLVEDAAESFGSLYRGRHAGTYGLCGALSFNGNKIITTGGGGMILTNMDLGQRAKHLTTTAKVPHSFEFVHDEIGFNYRMPNINAALGCAQLEQLEYFVECKRRLADRYREVLDGSVLQFVTEPVDCRSNYWLNAVICDDAAMRDALLKETNEAQVMTRPVWELMHHLPMFEHCLRGDLVNAEWLAERIVNLPSSVPPESLR